MNDEHTTSSPPEKPQPARAGSSFGIPVAIVIAAALIAGAIYLGGNGSGNTQAPNTAEEESPEEQTTPDVTVEPVTDEDHIRGNPNAPILMIEYSDYDCPFCKNFHETMNRVMDEYGQDGRVAWVYRHFPLEQLHPNAPAIAHASECVAELGGNEAFWTFSDLIFEERGRNEATDLARLPEFAETAGVDPEEFQSCQDSGRYTEEIEADVEEAIAAGGQGTPHTIVQVGDQRGVINGAQPYSAVKQVIDRLLGQIEGGGAGEGAPAQ